MLYVKTLYKCFNKKISGSTRILLSWILATLKRFKKDPSLNKQTRKCYYVLIQTTVLFEVWLLFLG